MTTCFVEWNGKPVKSVKNAFARAVDVAGLDLTDGNVTPHTLRHTAATWLMQRGVDPWEAAGFLGMSVQVLIDTYGHHHPNHLRGAADAITRKPRTPSVLRARPRTARGPVDREQTWIFLNERHRKTLKNHALNGRPDRS